MNCRICGSELTILAGEVEYYSGFAWQIFDCTKCGCRFTQHDDSIYTWLHEQPGSIYAFYRELAENSKRLFDAQDLKRMCEFLSRTSKYKFIIDSIRPLPKTARLLEVGCSRGHLAAFFILAGYDFLGIDVSAGAVNAANQAFGNHFVVATSSSLGQRGSFDVIYHTGMIGCVDDPVRTTRELMDLLKPGGRLLFNAPNKDACGLEDQLWIDSAPPPDVVTLFPSGFWKHELADAATVKEEVEMKPPRQSFIVALRRYFGQRWKKPRPTSLDSSAAKYVTDTRHPVGTVWAVLERVLSRLAETTGLAKIASPRPTPFGLLVIVTKR